MSAFNTFLVVPDPSFFVLPPPIGLAHSPTLTQVFLNLLVNPEKFDVQRWRPKPLSSFRLKTWWDLYKSMPNQVGTSVTLLFPHKLIDGPNPSQYRRQLIKSIIHRARLFLVPHSFGRPTALNPSGECAQCNDKLPHTEVIRW
jgi:hypothetical protein